MSRLSDTIIHSLDELSVVHENLIPVAEDLELIGRKKDAEAVRSVVGQVENIQYNLIEKLRKCQPERRNP